MKTRLVPLKHKSGVWLYKRVASNGSSARAWIKAPAYVIYNGLALYKECDWEFEALQAFTKATGGAQ